MMTCVLLQCFSALFYVSSALAIIRVPCATDYFPSINGDLSKLSWQHAANTRTVLNKALKNPKILMIEGDICMGHTKGNSKRAPILSHPPEDISDMYLEDFLKEVIKAAKTTKKGIALDFKTDEAFNAAWPILNKFKDKINFPVWIYADVLVGPGKPKTTPLNGPNILSKVQQHLPGALVALGWTNDPKGENYSEQMFNDMRDLIKNQNVRFRIHLLVKTTFAATSKDRLIQLVHDIDRFQGRTDTGLSIWMSQACDGVNYKLLKSLMAELGKEKIAFDVPTPILTKILGIRRRSIQWRS